ncbi:cytochrome P450 [Trichoderma citrinoviride]|uniref:Cytochrome P450 n=1 Tax=Trichoderma citrinoviride TaxID=58853 RepID=A0A2T4BFQ1_9HYPO|nr:cytochrome P450 [Trichoderma citrinoviride]PTB68156.1 cytochrome P450 [Trichoderma citrinoviride]
MEVGSWLIWTPLWALGYGLGVLLLSITTIVLYRLFLHPLARIPGPKLAAISNIWHAYHARSGRMFELGKRLHREYGEVVRVGPNELCLKGSTKGFEKTDFYLATSLNTPKIDACLRPHFADSLDLLSERDMKRYRLQRRLIGRVYQTANVVKFEAAVDDVIKQVIARLEALNGAEIDLKEWMHIIAVECLGASVLSWSPGLLKAGTDWGSSAHSYLGWRRKSVMGLFPTLTKLTFRSNSLEWIFRDVWNLKYPASSKFRSFFPDVGKRISRRMSALKPNAPKDNRADLMADLIQLHKDKPDFTVNYLRKMAMTNFGAGHETLASTLTSIFTMVGTHDDVQRRVRQEIRSATDASSYAGTLQLQYLRAAAREAMRLHPVLSMSLPRRVPDAGLHVHGYFIPGGTTVGCNPVALHRNADVVTGSDPEAYDPDRWLGGESSGTRLMERYSLNWGGGPRICPGKNLAEMVVYKVISALFERFNVEVSVPPEVGQPSYFLSMITGVKARFLSVAPQPAGETAFHES